MKVKFLPHIAHQFPSDLFLPFLDFLPFPLSLLETIVVPKILLNITDISGLPPAVAFHDFMSKLFSCLAISAILLRGNRAL